MPAGDVLVVVPTYQERENVELLLRAVRRAVPTAAVLVVDDASPDGTAELVEELARELGDIHVLRRPAKSGLGSAYRDGFAWARGHGFDTVVQMDADLSHDPADLPALLAASAAGADLVIGSRYRPGGEVVGWPRGRLVLSRLGNLYAATVLRMPLTDSTAGYRVWRGSMLDVLARQDVRAEGYGFQVEMAFRTMRWGGRIDEVPIRFVDRQRGASKLDRSIIFEAGALVLRLAARRRHIPRGQAALTSV
jgi:dolichol-phosphate mannosyltransferase